MSFIKREFKIKNIWLNHDEADLFVTSRWHGRDFISRWYLAFRWFFALYHTAWLLFNFIDEEGENPTFADRLYFFIYLTNWSYIVLTVMNVYWAIVETTAFVKYRKEGYISKTVGVKLKTLWTLQNITYMPAFMVTIIYWVALFEPGAKVVASNVEVHIMNSVYSVVELMMSATPYRLFHIYQPIIYLLIYVFFSLFYYLGGGTTEDGLHYIYPVLDWEDVGGTMTFIAIGAAGSILLQILVWLVYAFREFLYKQLVARGHLATGMTLPN